MTGILVDSCVILDIMTEDRVWYEWSAQKLKECAEKHPIYINQIIYSEISVGYEKIEELERSLPQTIFKRAPISWEAAFLAGKAFLHYKRTAGGKKTLPLPDFFIGAHAVIDHLTLLTRNANRFKYYYPSIKLISPHAY